MMRKLFFAAACAAALGLFAPVEASAQFPARRALARTVQATTGTRTFQPVRNVIKTVAPHYYQNVPMSIEEKAKWLGSNQVVGHVGAIPPGLFEGTSTNCATPQEAVASTCKPANGGVLVNSVWMRQPNGLYTAVNHYRPHASQTPTPVHQAVYTQTVPSQLQPGVTVLPGQHVVFPSVGTAHVAERAVWRPSYTANAVTCSGPNCQK